MDEFLSKEAKVFAKYLETRKVLIADTSAASRSGLFSVFHELGSKTSNLILVNTFKQAQAAIASEKPAVVAAEYELGRRCGLELLHDQKEQRAPQTRDTIFVIVTGNTSQSAVARAAEEDIDAYILKPFTAEIVRKTIIKAALNKLNPPAYYRAIEDGKKLLLAGSLDEAEKKFQSALSFDPAPALACFYIGQVQLIHNLLVEAESQYERGLTYNRIHYKCLVGLYDLLMQRQEHVKAYAVVRKISHYFPANPKRLAEVLRLAIICGKYEDIEQYYAVFTNIDEREEVLIRYVCAALVVCGKYYLGTKLGHSRALELFQKAAATGAGRVKILKEIVLALLDYGLYKDAQPFLTKFPPISFESSDFLLLRFLISNAEGDSSSLIIDQGRALIAKGVKEERLYAALLERMSRAGMSVGAIDEVLRPAILHFPGKKEFFEGLLKRGKVS